MERIIAIVAPMTGVFSMTRERLWLQTSTGPN